MSDFNDDHDTEAMLEAADVERNGRYTDAQLERDIVLLSRLALTRDARAGAEGCGCRPHEWCDACATPDDWRLWHGEHREDDR